MAKINHKLRIGVTAVFLGFLCVLTACLFYSSDKQRTLEYYPHQNGESLLYRELMGMHVSQKMLKSATSAGGFGEFRGFKNSRSQKCPHKSVNNT